MKSSDELSIIARKRARIYGLRVAGMTLGNPTLVGSLGGQFGYDECSAWLACPPEQQILAPSDQVLRGLPEDYIHSLPRDVQQVILRWLERASSTHEPPRCGNSLSLPEAADACGELPRAG